jgi:thioredoxin reductase
MSSRRVRVLVVGSGVAGLEAARLLAEAGHDVVMRTRARELGGWLSTESQLPGRGDIRKELEFMMAGLTRGHVHVDRGTSVEVKDIESGGYDHVVVATGAENQEFSLDGDRIPSSPFRAFVRKRLLDPHRTNGALVVFDEDHSAALYAAVEYAARYYDRVVLMTPKTTFATGIPYVDTIGVYRRLFQLGVEMYIAAIPKRVENRHLVYRNPYTEDEEAIADVSAFVYATPRTANDRMGRELKAQGKSVFMVGDCLAPRGVMAAIADSKKAYETIMRTEGS